MRSIAKITHLAELRKILREEADRILYARRGNSGHRGEFWVARIDGPKRKRAPSHAHRRSVNSVITRTADPASSYVYVMGAAGGAIKIGYAADVSRRAAAIQTGSPHKIIVFGAEKLPVSAVRAVESACHARLADFRLKGEWFDYDPYEAVEMVRAVAANILERAQAT